ncbi:MAG: AraC family transcriptional regulator [Oscillospiraceae bacterium]|nr:AraC family transcriptional regulator [Oscillospiraceae bacterium]
MNEIIFSNAAMPVVNGCGLLAAPEPFFHADRTVDFNVMIYVLEGTIFVTEGDSDYEIKNGGLLFLKRGIRHLGKREIPRGTRWFYVHFYFEEVPDCRDFISSDKKILPYSPTKYSAPLPKMLTGLRGSEIEKRIMELWERCCSDDISRGWYVNLRLAELLSFIALREWEIPAPKRLSDRIEEYLSAHIAEPFSAKDIEREFFLSYKRLAAVFKEERGISMQQLHDRLRMDEACRLLRSTMMPVSEAAPAVGYSDPLYFSRRFRQIIGSSPTEFRRSAAELF